MQARIYDKVVVTRSNHLTAVADSIYVRVVSYVQFGLGHRAVLVKIHDAVGALDTAATKHCIEIVY